MDSVRSSLHDARFDTLSQAQLADWLNNHLWVTSVMSRIPSIRSAFLPFAGGAASRRQSDRAYAEDPTAARPTPCALASSRSGLGRPGRRSEALAPRRLAEELPADSQNLLVSD